MFFRNLTFFRFSPALDLSALEAGMADFVLKPVGPLEMSSRGFVSPFGRDEEALTHRVGSGIWLTVGGEDKILPSAVVNEVVAQKAAEIEERERRKLGGRARKRLKEEVLFELLPRAFVRPVRVNAHIDTELGFIAIDTASRRVAEAVVTEIRQALGSFPALPLNAETTPRVVLTGWLAGEDMPAGLTLGDEALLADPADRGAQVRASRHPLDCDEIGKHLEAGKQCSKLALNLDDHLSFVIGDDLVVRKLKFLDGAVEPLENTERDSLRAELDARYALMVGELKRLWAVLAEAFKLSAVESEPRPESASTVAESDPMLDAAIREVQASRSASISRLQRVLKIGYNRAARMIEAMEGRGIVSPPAFNGDRRVLFAPEPRRPLSEVL